MEINLEIADHDMLVGTCWANESLNDQEHHVYFVTRGSLYLLANYETGIVAENLTFYNVNELVNELKNGWYLL